MGVITPLDILLGLPCEKSSVDSRGGGDGCNNPTRYIVGFAL